MWVVIWSTIEIGLGHWCFIHAGVGRVSFLCLPLLPKQWNRDKPGNQDRWCFCYESWTMTMTQIYALTFNPQKYSESFPFREPVDDRGEEFRTSLEGTPPFFTPNSVLWPNTSSSGDDVGTSMMDFQCGQRITFHVLPTASRFNCSFQFYKITKELRSTIYSYHILLYRNGNNNTWLH